MASINKVILVGNAGQDAEFRQLPSGQSVAKVTLATTSRQKDKTTGQWVDGATDWHRISFFDRLAEVAGQYIKKGSQIFVEGRIKYGKYTNKEGIEVSTCDIIAVEMQLLGRRGDGAAGSGDGASTYTKPAARPVAPAFVPAVPARAPATPPPTAPSIADLDDDIPF